jgi:hypothetical protein
MMDDLFKDSDPDDDDQEDQEESSSGSDKEDRHVPNFRAIAEEQKKAEEEQQDKDGDDSESSRFAVDCSTIVTTDDSVMASVGEGPDWKAILSTMNSLSPSTRMAEEEESDFAVDSGTLVRKKLKAKGGNFFFFFLKKK